MACNVAPPTQLSKLCIVPPCDDITPTKPIEDDSASVGSGLVCGLSTPDPLGDPISRPSMKKLLTDLTAAPDSLEVFSLPGQHFAFQQALGFHRDSPVDSWIKSVAFLTKK